MKQKQLLSLRAFLCLALTVLLGVLCMLPLFEVNVKVSSTTADSIIEVLERKKDLIESSERDLSEKELREKLESYDELINDLKRACYYSSVNYETILDELVVENEENGTPLPYGFKNKEDVEKWKNELSRLLEKEDDDENRKAFSEKYFEWKALEEMSRAGLSEEAENELDVELLQLEKELLSLAKKIKPSALSRLKEDSLGYEVKLSLSDLITTLASGSIKPIISAVKLISAQINYLTDEESQKIVSNPLYYMDVEVEHFEMAIALELVSDIANIGDDDISGTVGDDKKTDMAAIDLLLCGLYDGRFAATYRVTLIIAFVVAAIMLLAVLVIAIRGVISSLFSIRNSEKFFKETQKCFISVSGLIILALLWFAICGGGKLSTFGILTFVLIILGYVAIGVTARCTALDKQKALYLDFAQVGGLIGVIATAIILLSGNSFMSGVDSMQTALATAIAVFGSFAKFVLIEALLLIGQLFLFFMSEYFMKFCLKRLACIPTKKKDVNETNDKSETLSSDIVRVVFGSLILVVFAFLGMDVNALLFVICFVIVLAVKIALKIINEKMFGDISNDDKDVLNALGGRYFDPESPVVVPFV